jgi:uncharacterized protein YcnI
VKKVLFVITVLFALTANTAMAHVVVRPASVGLASRQVFTVSVPTEKDIPTIGLRILIPEEIKSVTPTVKPGWRIEVKKQPTGNKVLDEEGNEIDEMKTTEIIWTGGLIPAEQRDEFTFATQVPARVLPINWRAYQTYQDGTVVAWDQTPGGDVRTPYSTTQVIDDLAALKQTWWEKNQINLTLGVSLLALIFSLVIFRKNAKQKENR